MAVLVDTETGAAGETAWLALPFFLLLIGSLAIALLRRNPKTTSLPGTQSIAGVWVFIAVLTASLLYFSIPGRPDVHPGMLRHASAAALVAPVAVLMAWRARGPVSMRVAGPLAFVIVASTAAVVLSERRAFLREAKAEIAEVTLALDALTERRVAVWDGHPDWRTGEAEFHLWGNHRYAQERYTEELLKTYPSRATLRLRDARRGIEPPNDGVAGEERLPDILVRWLRNRGSRQSRPTATLAFGDDVTALAAPVAELDAILGDYRLEELARSRFGETRSDTLVLAREPWLIVRPLAPE